MHLLLKPCTDSNITSVLTFIAPIQLNNNNMEIICARGSGNSEGDRMSCPFIIASTLVIIPDGIM